MCGAEKVKKLIVNADDFGLDACVNQGIILAHESGIVTSASLLTCGRAFDEAVELGKQHRSLGLGIHLALNEEQPVLPPEKIGTLLEPDSGYFLSYIGFLRKYFSGRIILAQLYSEFEAQIKKFIAAGLRPTHLDSHKHIHLIPGILEMVIELARKFGISCLRLPRVPLLSGYNSRRCFRAVAVCGLSILANLQLRQIKRSCIRFPKFCFGLIESGRLDETSLAELLKQLPVGTNEIICHPGLAGTVPSGRYKWNYYWLEELSSLTSLSAKTLVKDLDIKLIRYDQIE